MRTNAGEIGCRLDGSQNGLERLSRGWIIEPWVDVAERQGDSFDADDWVDSEAYIDQFVAGRLAGRYRVRVVLISDGACRH